MIPIDKTAPKSIHLQLYEYLQDQINVYEFSPHQKLPSENELSAMFDISRTTVRNVISRMVAEQQLYRVAGKGTFVAERKINTVTIARKGMREQLEEMGYETDTVLLEKKEIPASRQVASKLDIAPGTPVYLISRVRYANGLPLSIHTNFLLKSLFPGILELDIEKMPLCDIQADRFGIAAKRGRETLESISASPTEASLLGVTSGSQFLLLGCTLYTENNTPFEYSKVIFRGDRIRLEVSIERN